MIQDVIELRGRGWKKRRDEENSPKTIDEITKEAESEKLDSQLNSALLNTPRKDDRNNDKKRTRKSYLQPGTASVLKIDNQLFHIPCLCSNCDRNQTKILFRSGPLFAVVHI